LIKIAVCDDEVVFAERIESLINKELGNYDEEYSIFTVNSGDKLLQLCFRERVDVVFLDIAMPDTDGFETAKKLQEIRKDIMLVFVSSMEEMVYQSYDFSPLWFVPKSQMNLMKNVIKKLIGKIYEKDINKRFVLLQIGNRVVEIDLNNTKYFKTDGHYIKFVERNGMVSESYRSRLNDIKLQLDSKWFVQSHNRYLVNLRMVRFIANSELVLCDDERVPVSRAKMNEVKEKFQDYLRSIR